MFNDGPQWTCQPDLDAAISTISTMPQWSTYCFSDLDVAISTSTWMWQSQPGLIRAFTTDRQGKGKVSLGCKNHLLLFSLPIRGPHFLLQTSLNQLEVLQSRTGREKKDSHKFLPPCVCSWQEQQEKPGLPERMSWEEDQAVTRRGNREAQRRKGAAGHRPA